MSWASGWRLGVGVLAALGLGPHAVAQASPGRSGDALPERAGRTLPAVGAHAQPPLELPTGKRATTAGRRADKGWIVAATPGSRSGETARVFGAEPILREAGVYVVDRDRARAFANRLEDSGDLAFAEPDARVHRADFPSDPLTPEQQWLRQVVPPSFTPPPVGPGSPVLGILEESLDTSHPEFSAGNVPGALSIDPETDEHGTGVSGVAGAPANGEGITGVWPGMRLRLFPNGTTCSTTVRAIAEAIRERVAVINMSYAFAFGDCFAHFVATQYAFGEGILPVAAGGNEFFEGNPLERPAFDNHVLTIAALNPDLSSAGFSNENPGIDLSAPGVDVLTSVPAAVDEDGPADGYARLDGTSFSSPIVAALAAWVAQLRPALSNDQLAGVLNESARDLGRSGYDVRFGHGLVNLDGALSQVPPPRDPGEPNDDIDWVNGERYAEPDPFIWEPGNGRTTVRANVDEVEDPVDVYRVRLPADGSLEIKANPAFGDPALEVWGARATTVYKSTARRVAFSDRAGSRTEAVSVRNRSRRPRIAYVDVFDPSDETLLDSRYRLQVKSK